MKPLAAKLFPAASLALAVGGVLAQPAGQGVSVDNVSFGGSEFVQAFNAAAGSPRLVMVFSPTCGRCLHGAYDVGQILGELPDADVKVFVLWSPILSGDTKFAALKAAGYLPDRRASHFWDVWKFGLNHYTSSLGYPEGKQAWDIFVLYSAGERWSEASAPKPVVWMQDHKLDIGVQYGKEALADRLRELIGAAKAGAGR